MPAMMERKEAIFNYRKFAIIHQERMQKKYPDIKFFLWNKDYNAGEICEDGKPEIILIGERVPRVNEQPIFYKVFNDESIQVIEKPHIPDMAVPQGDR